ncbi:MAG: DUF6691 family protein [Smithellaceae bacterium]
MSVEQILGLVTGLVFGFLMQKGRVIRFEKQVGAMLLRDMTIFKFMLSAALVGVVGIYLLSDAGVITLSHKPMNVGAVVLGGILFGAGWAVMGFCPGTSVAALGEGRIHALFAIAGMIVGAAVFAEIYPAFSSTIGAWKNFGKIGWSDVFGVSHWVIIPVFWVLVIALFYGFEKKGL